MFWENSRSLGIHCLGSSLFLAVLEKKSKNTIEPLHLIEGKLPTVFHSHSLKDDSVRHGIAELIIDIIEENNINFDSTCMALHPTAVLVRRSSTSLGDSKEIREHLRWESMTMLDAKDDSLMMDFFSVRDWVFSVGVREEVLCHYRDIARFVKIKKFNMDVPHLALYNSIYDTGLFSLSGAQILIYIGEGVGFVVLICEGEVVQIGTYKNESEDSFSQSLEQGVLSIVQDLGKPIEDVFYAGNIFEEDIQGFSDKLGANPFILDPLGPKKQSITNRDEVSELNSQFAIAIGLAKRELIH